MIEGLGDFGFAIGGMQLGSYATISVVSFQQPKTTSWWSNPGY